MSSEKVAEDIGNCIRQNIPWQNLPIHIRQVLHNNQRDYMKYVFNYSLKNQLRFRGNLASKVFHNEQRYYELLIQKGINGLCLFPYHLADIVTKGLRVTPFNYYLEVLSQLLRNDKSYDTLPNFTAADCLRILSIGRNEYLSLISELKTHSSRSLLFSSKPNPLEFLPRFPARIRIEPWWTVEIGYVLEADIRFVSAMERSLIDDLIDFGSQLAGKCDCEIVHSLYRKGLIYLNVPITGEDRICIPPLRNFVMNRVSGDYFENLLYKIFLSADEHMTISELAQMLQVDLDSVKQAVSFLCRLGFAQIKETGAGLEEQRAQYHSSWELYRQKQLELKEAPQITPLNYSSLLDEPIDRASSMSVEKRASVSQSNGQEGIHTNSSESSSPQNTEATQVNHSSNSKAMHISDINANDSVESSLLGYVSSDGNNSDFSFAAIPTPSPTPTATADASSHKAMDAKDSRNRNSICAEYVQCSEESGLSLDADDVNSVEAQKRRCEGSLSQTSSPTSTPNSTSPSSLAAKGKAATQHDQTPPKTGKRVGFLFDSTLTAFLMMGNLSPGLKNHAVTMFEVGKLCEESMDTFLSELEKVSLLDAEGEGDVSRYFAHAVILRSTICSLRHLLPGGLDLLRLECLECLDQKTRDRVLEKKYKFIISATPLTASLSHEFSIPFFGQFYRSSDYSHMWTRLFYNHITGYGPPSLFLCRGTVLKTLPRIFLGYGKLLVNILHSDSYVINSENFRNLNDQLRNGCVLVQGYGIRTPGDLHYESFPFDPEDKRQSKWLSHCAVQKLRKYLDLEHNCGFITFLDTGVPDIGCEQEELQVHLRRPKVPGSASNVAPISTGVVPNSQNSKSITSSTLRNPQQKEGLGKTQKHAAIEERKNPGATDELEATRIGQSNPSPAKSFENKNISEVTTASSSSSTTSSNSCLKSPDENYFALTPKNSSPANVYTSDDCNALLATELAKCQAVEPESGTKQNAGSADSPAEDSRPELVSQGSIEIPIASAVAAAVPHTNAAGDASADSEDSNFENTTEAWTLLDVNFGVPLFDVNANTHICEQIARRLCLEENLEKLPESAAAMNRLLLDFIRQCLYFEDEGCEQLKIGKLLPHPRINLAFENGRVCYWNGR